MKPEKGVFMKKQAFNPYLPSHEYIPDGEPYVFDGRVYIYGSHDLFNGHVFCLGDYVCWSAPVDDLGNWRYEGVIYPKTADPLNKNGKMCLYAPDVTKGEDGKYYLYYVLDKVNVVSVAVCDTPAGQYKFLGYVHYKDGTKLGEKPGDEPQFDPGVLTENGKTYLYTGFCPRGGKERHGAMCTVLDSDMLTVIEEPKIIVPGVEYEAGTGYEGHAYFEAASIRKCGDTYYFIYSSTPMHELCYATSKNPTGDFVYGGVIVSNTDIGIDSYKKADLPVAYGANNHGSMVQINDDWYIFYHRHTNNTWFSRQGCAEKIKIESDGKIKQVEITSCGLNGGSLEGKGEYPAYIACHLFTDTPCMYVGEKGEYPRVVQEKSDGYECDAYVTNIQNSATIGFKYFDYKNLKSVGIYTRAYIHGEFEVRTKIDGEVLGTIKVEGSNVWEYGECAVKVPDGAGALYLTFKGTGKGELKSVVLNA